ncbi:hypothetical protein P2318_07395 [Myxococcaceae bacterium GXIMD 01537]
MTTGYPPPGPGPSPQVDPRDAVNIPAILLMVTGGIMALSGLWGLVAPAKDMSAVLDDPNFPEQLRPMFEFLGSGAGRATNLLPVALGGLVFFGGLKMRQLQSRGLAMAASIVALIPCFGCCCLGLPVGIWSLIVLSKPEVKAAFRP